MRSSLAAGLAVLAACGAFGCNETLDAHYDSLEAAKRQGAIERGWIPRFAPPSASSIRERHDLDTNEVWGAFDFSSGDAELLRKQLQSLRVEDLAGREARAAGTDWWPPELTGSLNAASLRNAGLDVFRESESGDFYAAVDWKRGRLYFWSRR